MKDLLELVGYLTLVLLLLLWYVAFCHWFGVPVA